jgi:hypothetical protein
VKKIFRSACSPSLNGDEAIDWEIERGGYRHDRLHPRRRNPAGQDSRERRVRNASGVGNLVEVNASPFSRLGNPLPELAVGERPRSSAWVSWCWHFIASIPFFAFTPRMRYHSGGEYTPQGSNLQPSVP